MILSDTPNKRLIDMTAGEFAELLLDVLQSLPKSEGEKPKKFVYGLGGLAQLLNCSTSTASKIKASGLLDEAISQFGNRLVIDVDKALILTRLSKLKSKNGKITI